MVEDFDLTVFRFGSFGRDFIKHQGMSPDAFIQLALQLTYYKYVLLDYIVLSVINIIFIAIT